MTDVAEILNSFGYNFLCTPEYIQHYAFAVSIDFRFSFSKHINLFYQIIRISHYDLQEFIIIRNNVIHNQTRLGLNLYILTS